MFWWLVGLVVAIYLLRLWWRVHTLPAQVLARQGANMHWVAKGRIDGAGGYKDVVFTKRGMDAAVSHQNGDVRLISPHVEEPFTDFIEIEKWLTKQDEVPTLEKRHERMPPAEDIAEEVTATVDAIRATILDNMAAELVISRAIKLVTGEPERTVSSIKDDGCSPEELANIVITNVVQDELSTGRYHTYRGVLNLLGNEMVCTWDHAIDELMRLGHYTKQQADKDKAWLREQITLIG